MAKDEDSTDRELNQLGKAAGGIYCQQWFTDSNGKRRRCTRKKHKLGKHK